MKTKIKAQYRPKLIHRAIELLDQNTQLKELNIFELHWAVELFLHCRLEEMDDGMEYHYKIKAAESAIYDHFEQLSDEESENDNVARFFMAGDSAADFEIAAEYDELEIPDNLTTKDIGKDEN